MTERKTSYLTGLSLANQYAASGAFKGNAAADFGAMLLLRSSMPFNGFSGSAVQRFLCGNLQATSLLATKGWGLRWLAGPQPGAQLELVYGDSALAQQSFVARPLVPTQMAQRTMLVHVFLLRDPLIAAPNNVTMLLYVNGALAARGAALSFTPADGTGVFRIGGGSVNGSAVDAPGIGVAGFGYCNAIAGASLAAKLATVQAMVDATVEQTLDTGDVSDDALITNLFSVRRSLSDPKALWAPVKGSVSLARVGSSSLAVEAGDPLFNDVPWEDLTPIPDPRAIFGASLLSWLRADDNAAGDASWPNRVTGAPAFALAGGAATPALVGGQAALLLDAAAIYSAALALAPGAFPGLINVMQYTLPLAVGGKAFGGWGKADFSECMFISEFVFGPSPDLTLYAQQLYGIDGQFALPAANSLNPPAHPILQGVVWNSPQELYLQGEVIPRTGGMGVLPVGNSVAWDLAQLGAGGGLPGQAGVRYAEQIMFDAGAGGLTALQLAQLKSYFSARYGTGVLAP